MSPNQIGFFKSHLAARIHIVIMQAGRATTVNYYGLLRDDASDGTAETESPDALIRHLPSEVLAVVLHDCKRDFAEYDRAFQDLGEDDQFFADDLLRTHGIVEALKYVRKKIWSPRSPRIDPAQRRICSFFPRRDGRARCWTCGGQHE